MKTRTTKIGFIVAMMGFAMMFGYFVPMCQPNTMIQTLQTRACDIFHLVLLFMTFFFSYVLIISGLMMLFYDLVIKRRQDLRNNL